MLGFLISLLVLALIVYAVKLVIDLLPLPATVKTIALIIVGIIGLIYLLNFIGVSVSLLGHGAWLAK